MTVPVPETSTIRPLLLVNAVPLTRATAVPSMISFSDAPSATPATVTCRPMMLCPGSTVSIAIPLNTVTAAPCSTNVGLLPAPVTTGASSTASTLTVTDAAVLVVPVSSVTVTLTVRAPLLGSVVLLLLYTRLCSNADTAAGLALALRATTSGLPLVPPVKVPMITPLYSTLLADVEICPAAVPVLKIDSTSWLSIPPEVSATRTLPPPNWAESASVTTALPLWSSSTPELFST